MQNCGYPIIPEYLSKEKVPDKLFNGIHVHSVYSQSMSISKKIAETCRIPKVSKTLEQLDLCTDAILLARDDAENHRKFAEIFLKNGKPIYIDKPIALSCKELDLLYGLSCDGEQIFSCSALRFAEELFPTKKELEAIGDLIEINGRTPKSWEKYAVHLVDPLIHYMNFENIKYMKSEKENLARPL